MFHKVALFAFLVLGLQGCGNDPPRIESISPTSGPLGGGTTLTITGANFEPSTLCYLNGVPCTGTASTGSGSLTCVTPPGNALGSVMVTVENRDGTRDHNKNGFAYTNGASQVTVSSVSPDTGAAGTSVTITGSGFEANCTVAFGSADATSVSVQSSTQLTCTVPTGTGAVTITITNSDSGTGSLSSGFTYSGSSSSSTETISVFAGTGTAGSAGDGGPATSAQLSGPQQVAFGTNGTLYVADTGNNRIQAIASSGTVSTVANGLNSPRGVALDSQGNVYIADSGNDVVEELVGTTLTVVAGTSGSPGATGNGGAATSALLNTPAAVALDGSNDLFIADSGNHEIREVTVGTGVISVFAGTGTAGSGGEGIVATQCALNSPQGVLVASTSVVYIADTGNGRVRQVQSGTISTFAGGGSTSPGDDGLATSAVLQQPIGLSESSSNAIVIADAQANVVRIVSGGTINLLAGNYTAGSTGNGGSATAAELSGPRGVAAGSGATYFIADTNNDEIREVQ